MTRSSTKAARYLLPCSCGQAIPVTTAQAGETVRCACGAEISVPSYREIRTLEPADTGKSASRRPARHWTGRHRRILIGCLVTAASLAFFGYSYATRPKRVDVGDLHLLAIWPYWQELRQGLERYPSPGERAYIERLNHSRVSQGIALSVAGAGLVFTAVSFIMRPQRARHRH
ncbi:MAG: hypothetical protein FJ276_09260 [Planctomycetes bacterium]|nr:hypothetical protein [Planctomycetota bacterium]